MAKVRRILIIGFEPIGRREGLRALKRGGFELWTFNNDHQLMRKATRHFEMHELSVYGKDAVDDAVVDDKYLRALKRDIGVPVYHLRRTEEIAGSVAYPIKKITARFGTYLTNSISYMLALAIYERVDEIHLYGIDMAREHEHAWERPSIEYFLGWARGAGITVVIPDSSDLLKCIGLYGYVDTYEYEARLREKIDRYKYAAQRYERDAGFWAGAADNAESWIRWMLLPGDHGKAVLRKARARKKWLLDRAKRYAGIPT